MNGRACAVCAFLSLCSPVLAQESATEGLLAEARVQALSADQCARLIGALKDPAESANWPRIPEALEANWRQVDCAGAAKDFHAHWVGRAGALAGMEFSAAESAFQTLKAFGRADLAGSVGPAWFKASDRWQRLGPKDLARLTLAMLAGPREDAGAARRKAVERAWTAYLEPMASLDRARQLECIYLVGAVGPNLTPPQRAATEKSLDRLYPTGGEGLAELSLVHVNVLSFAYRRLGAGEKASEVAAAWMRLSDDWKSPAASPEALLQLGYGLRLYSGTGTVRRQAVQWNQAPNVGAYANPQHGTYTAYFALPGPPEAKASNDMERETELVIEADLEDNRLEPGAIATGLYQPETANQISIGLRPQPNGDDIWGAEGNKTFSDKEEEDLDGETGNEIRKIHVKQIMQSTIDSDDYKVIIQGLRDNAGNTGPDGDNQTSEIDWLIRLR